MRNSLTAIVPCFNEAEVIEITYQRLHAVAKGLPVPCKILFVNDGSSDSTGELLDRIAASDSSVEVLHFSRNFGHQPAVCAGIEHCTTDMAVILDADLQDPPELIPEMIDTMVREEADVVYCVRRHRDGETFFKKFTSKVFYRVLNYMSEVSLPVDTGDFRLVSRRVINEFCRLPERQKYVRGLMAWVGFHQVRSNETDCLTVRTAGAHPVLRFAHLGCCHHFHRLGDFPCVLNAAYLAAYFLT